MGGDLPRQIPSLASQQARVLTDTGNTQGGRAGQQIGETGVGPEATLCPGPGLCDPCLCCAVGQWPVGAALGLSAGGQLLGGEAHARPWGERGGPGEWGP